MERSFRNFLSVLTAVIIAIGATGCVKAQGFFFGNPLVGKPAPDFTLQTLEGGARSLNDAIKGKKAIVFFWSTWCPHCREQIVDLSRQKAKLDAQGVAVFLVDIGESPNLVRRFASANKLDFEIWLDSEGAVSEMYQVFGIPTLIFIGDDGKVRASLHGLPEDYMELLK